MRVREAYDCIRHAIDAGRMANGYLIVGPVRNEGMELATKILQLLFCDSDDKPCGTCDRCRHVADRTEADIHWLAPEKKSRIISVESMRDNMLAPISQTSLGGGWKAGVILSADRLNDASSNAFLKTLEEPPEKTLFLLLTDAPQFLLATIISRCQRIELSAKRDLPPHHRERILETLSGPLFHDPLECSISANILNAVLADMKKEAEEMVMREVKEEADVIDEDKDEITAKVSARYREMRTDFLLVLTGWFRDLMILRSGRDPSLIHNRAYSEILQQRAKNLTLAETIYNMNALEDLTARLEKNMPDDSLILYTIDRMHHGVK